MDLKIISWRKMCSDFFSCYLLLVLFTTNQMNMLDLAALIECIIIIFLRRLAF